MSNLNESPEAVLDFEREARIGLGEAVFCTRKTTPQIASILHTFLQASTACLLTRLAPAKERQLPESLRQHLDYDPLSRTGIFLQPHHPPRPQAIAIVSGGTSDAPVCREAARTLGFYGVSSQLFQDVGVTGLWRLTQRLEEIRRYPLIIAVAGMEGAIFSVLGGLVDGVVIAVPTSVGYGVAPKGELALHSALGSCAPGILTVNIDNGFGAACAALRILNRFGGPPATG